MGDPHNQAGKSPLRRSLHATGWNWNRESFVACKQCQFAWNGVLLVSFFGLHGIRLSLETHPGLRPPPAPSQKRSGLFGKSLVKNHRPCPESLREPPAQPWVSWEGLPAPSPLRILGHRTRGRQRLRPGSGSVPACSGSPRLTEGCSQLCHRSKAPSTRSAKFKPKAVTAIGNDLFPLKGKKHKKEVKKFSEGQKKSFVVPHGSSGVGAGRGGANGTSDAIPRDTAPCHGGAPCWPWTRR